MARIAPFEQHVERYERWFEAHRAAYCSELLALRALLPWEGRGVEIGVGSGRFAAPLGIPIGLDPSPAMLRLAKARGILCVRGIAEALPFAADAFDYALVVTTLCFVDDPLRMFREARRVLRARGKLVVGFIDRASRLGQAYLARKPESVFYREATFYTAQEVDRLLDEAGFGPRTWLQTLWSSPETDVIEPVRPGTGEGAFVAVGAVS